MEMLLPLRKAVDEERVIIARALVEQPDRTNEVADYEAAKAAFSKWSEEQRSASHGKSLGNVRVMHQPQVAGRVIDLKFNDTERAVEVAIKVDDDDTWQKCKAGSYVGLSVGGSYDRKWTDPKNPALKRYAPKLTELSIVDRPCIPGATFMLLKSDGSQAEITPAISLVAQPSSFATLMKEDHQPSGRIDVGVIAALRERVMTHNEANTDAWGKAKLGMLKAVYLRGLRAHKPHLAKSAPEWGYGRVDAFLRVLGGAEPGGKFTDRDLLPAGHPRLVVEKPVQKATGPRTFGALYKAQYPYLTSAQANQERRRKRRDRIAAATGAVLYGGGIGGIARMFGGKALSPITGTAMGLSPRIRGKINRADDVIEGVNDGVRTFWRRKNIFNPFQLGRDIKSGIRGARASGSVLNTTAIRGKLRGITRVPAVGIGLLAGTIAASRYYQRRRRDQELRAALAQKAVLDGDLAKRIGFGAFGRMARRGVRSAVEMSSRAFSPRPRSSLSLPKGLTGLRPNFRAGRVVDTFGALAGAGAGAGIGLAIARRRADQADAVGGEKRGNPYRDKEGRFTSRERAAFTIGGAALGAAAGLILTQAGRRALINRAIQRVKNAEAGFATGKRSVVDTAKVLAGEKGAKRRLSGTMRERIKAVDDKIDAMKNLGTSFSADDIDRMKGHLKGAEDVIRVNQRTMADTAKRLAPTGMIDAVGDDAFGAMKWARIRQIIAADGDTFPVKLGNVDAKGKEIATLFRASLGKNGKIVFTDEKGGVLQSVPTKVREAFEEVSKTKDITAGRAMAMIDKWAAQKKAEWTIAGKDLDSAVRLRLDNLLRGIDNDAVRQARAKAAREWATKHGVTIVGEMSPEAQKKALDTVTGNAVNAAQAALSSGSPRARAKALRNLATKLGVDIGNDTSDAARQKVLATFKAASEKAAKESLDEAKNNASALVKDKLAPLHKLLKEHEANIGKGSAIHAAEKEARARVNDLSQFRTALEDSLKNTDPTDEAGISLAWSKFKEAVADRFKNSYDKQFQDKWTRLANDQVIKEADDLKAVLENALKSTSDQVKAINVMKPEDLVVKFRGELKDANNALGGIIPRNMSGIVSPQEIEAVQKELKNVVAINARDATRAGFEAAKKVLTQRLGRIESAASRGAVFEGEAQKVIDSMITSKAKALIARAVSPVTRRVGAMSRAAQEEASRTLQMMFESETGSAKSNLTRAWAEMAQGIANRAKRAAKWTWDKATKRNLLIGAGIGTTVLAGEIDEKGHPQLRLNAKALRSMKFEFGRMQEYALDARGNSVDPDSPAARARHWRGNLGITVEKDGTRRWIFGWDYDTADNRGFDLRLPGSPVGRQGQQQQQQQQFRPKVLLPGIDQNVRNAMNQIKASEDVIAGEDITIRFVNNVPQNFQHQHRKAKDAVVGQIRSTLGRFKGQEGKQYEAGLEVVFNNQFAGKFTEAEHAEMVARVLGHPQGGHDQMFSAFMSRLGSAYDASPMPSDSPIYSYTMKAAEFLGRSNMVSKPQSSLIMDAARTYAGKAPENRNADLDAALDAIRGAFDSALADNVGEVKRSAPAVIAAFRYQSRSGEQYGDTLNELGDLFYMLETEKTKRDRNYWRTWTLDQAGNSYVKSERTGLLRKGPFAQAGHEVIKLGSGAAYDEQKHRRQPKGSDKGGEFAPKAGTAAHYGALVGGYAGYEAGRALLARRFPAFADKQAKAAAGVGRRLGRGFMRNVAGGVTGGMLMGWAVKKAGEIIDRTMGKEPHVDSYEGRTGELFGSIGGQIATYPIGMAAGRKIGERFGPKWGAVGTVIGGGIAAAGGDYLGSRLVRRFMPQAETDDVNDVTRFFQPKQPR